MHVLYMAPFAARTGYAQAAHDYMLALHRAGVSIEIQPLVRCDTDDLEERYRDLLPLVRGFPGHVRREPTHVIVHTVPALAPRLGQDFSSEKKKILITTWETGEVPVEISEAIDECFDLVIVPSEFCLRSMPALWDKASVVGHCFDPIHWPSPWSVERERPLPKGDRDGYVFYSILGWSERKNPVGLLKAYFSAFTSSDDVTLSLKVSGFNPTDLDQLRAASGVDRESLPAVEVIDDYLDHDEVVDLHHRGDCFVTAARGEGWNLPAFEACVTGNVLIAPELGGHTEFARLVDNYYPVACQLTPAVTPPAVRDSIDLGGVSVRPVVRDQPAGLTIKQWWAEPDLHRMTMFMRQVFDTRQRENMSGRTRLIDQFSYGVIAGKLAEIIK